MLLMHAPSLMHSQAYRVLGHLNALGDPASLAVHYARGVAGFVRNVGSGHLAAGAKDLVQGVVGGTAQSAAKITGAIESAVERFEYVETEDQERVRNIQIDVCTYEASV